MSKLKQKPKWGRPKLIILTRGKPEEGVLSPCKDPTAGENEGARGSDFNNQCRGGTECHECSDAFTT